MNKKNFVQETTFVQFFMYWKAKKNFGAIRKFLKIFIFENLLNVFWKKKISKFFVSLQIFFLLYNT